MINELEFGKVDIAIHEQGPHLRPSEVAADVSLAAQRIRIGPKLTPAAFSLEIEADEETATQQLKAICKLGRMTAVSVLTVTASAVGVGMDAEVK
ncbi:MAG: sugar phosphate isomerase/epimerase, partial [Planctomycetota bacterium]